MPQNAKKQKFSDVFV